MQWECRHNFLLDHSSQHHRACVCCTNLENLVLSSSCRFVPFGSITVSHVFVKSGLDLLLSLTHTVNISICSTTLVLPFVHCLFFPLAPSSLFVLPPLAPAPPPLPSPPLPSPSPPLRMQVIGLLLPNQSFQQIIFWQWINQSHNACVIYVNRNAFKVSHLSPSAASCTVHLLTHCYVYWVMAG